MSKNIRTQIGKVIGKTLNSYHARVKPVIDDIKFKEQYQGRIIDCMVGEVDDNYIETPETDAPIVKLEHSKEGIVKVPSIKGKTILIDSEGNETDTPAEGCRLVSVGEDEDNKLIILSKNKNIFDGKLEFGSIGAYTGVDATTQDGNRSVGFTRVKGGVKYYVSKNSLEKQQRHLRFIFYNANKEYISYSDLQYNRNIITVPNDAYYLRLKYDLPEKFYDISITEGETLTSYVPHQSHKTEILLNEPLRALPNGVCDEIVDNKIIRRIGRHVFSKKQYGIGNESAGWKPQVDTIPFYLYQDLFEPIIENIKAYSLCYSTTMPINKGFVNSDIEGLGVSGGSRIYIGGRIKRDRLESQDGEGVAKIINGTEFFYELAEPIIEELPNGITLQGFDDTTMYIENSITPTVSYGYNALIPYKEELRTQKEEVETNTLDIENNIIPYLMDMEYNLMLMEDN